MANAPRTTKTTVKNGKPDVYRNAEGEVLPVEDFASIVAAYRATADMLADKPNSTDHVDDASAEAIIKSIHGEGNDIDQKRAQALLDAEPVTHDEVQPVESVVAQEAAHVQTSKAAEAAKCLANDEFAKLSDSVANAREELNEAPLNYAERFVGFSYNDGTKTITRAGWFGKTIAEARAAVALFPRPGTKAKDGDNNPDQFQESYINDKGERRTRNVTFVGKLFDASPYGAALLAEINALEDKDSPESKAQPNSQQRVAVLGRKRGRRNTITGKMRLAIRVVQQMVRVAEMPQGKVKVRFVRVLDDTGNETAALLNTPRNIYVFNAAQPDNGEAVSVTTFLSWKPEQCLTNPTLQGLKNTAQRTGKAGKKNKGKVGAGQLPKLDDFETSMVMAGHGMQDDDWLASLVARMNGPNGKSLVRTLGDMKVELSNLYNPKVYGFMSQYEDMITEENAKKAAEAAAKKGDKQAA